MNIVNNANVMNIDDIVNIVNNANIVNIGQLHWFLNNVQMFFFAIREGSCYQIGWIFGKVPKGGRGEGSFSIQKFMLQILGTLNRAFWPWNWYKKSKFRVQGMFFSKIVLRKIKTKHTLKHTCKKRVVLRRRLLWPKKNCGKSA